ncbi:MAG: hypothetical protein R3Y05_06350 [bacterium]
MGRKPKEKQKSFTETNKGLDQLLDAINNNTTAVNSVQQNTKETNNKLNLLIDINSEMEYNSNILINDSPRGSRKK